MMRVNVTAEDIEDGTKTSPIYCAFALALRRCKGVGRPKVSSNLANFILNGQQYEVSLSRRAVRFINAFDRGDVVRPQSFYLKLP